VRVIVATHRNLQELVRKGTFREDLYHRIYVFPIILPPLRERPDDIPVLVDYCSRQVAEHNGWKPKPFAAEAIEELRRYSWPGNVRELRNVVERLLLLADSEVDQAAVRLALPQGPSVAQVSSSSGPLADRVRAFEKEVLIAELKRHSFQMTETARSLDLERSHLYKKCQQLGIDLEALKQE